MSFTRRTCQSGRMSRFQIILAAIVALQCIYIRFTWAQPGFLSLDCGNVSPTAYNDSTYGITWVSDTAYVSTGQIYQKVEYVHTILSLPAWASFRYFPGNRKKDCYVLPAIPFQTYLVRAFFYYSNFLPPPRFIVEIEGEYGCLIDIPSILPTSTPVGLCEVILSATTDTIYVCLAPSTTTDIPFITSLELRALDTAAMYKDVQNAYMYNVERETLGTTLSETVVRYPYDKYDRPWLSRNVLEGEKTDPNASIINTTKAVVVSTPSNVDMVPQLAMQSAYEWAPGTSFNISCASFISGTSTRNYYVALYFAEIDPKAANESSRIFDLFLNDQLAVHNISVSSLAGGTDTTLELSVKNVTFNNTGTCIQLIPHANSTLGPILNAYEIYVLAEPVAPRTSAAAALAIENIKNALNLTTWTGDPCVFTSYDWISCTSTPNVLVPPNILTVKLTDYNLTGTIPDALSNLTALTALWLDHNSLQGTIPESLSALTNLVSLRLDNNELTGPIPTWLASLDLQELFLSNNNFTGMVPAGLLKKANLTFQYSGNPYLCISNTTCSLNISLPPSPGITPNPIANSNHIAGIVGASVGGSFVVIAAILVLVYFCYSRSKFNNNYQGDMPRAYVLSPGPQKLYGIDNIHKLDEHQVAASPQVAQAYSFVEVMKATNNFENVLGKGSFGLVYYGKLPNEQEVAVKRLSSTSQQGATEFFTEVDVLTKVHHRNLVSLIGFCHMEKEQILIYEYVSNGTLRESLYGTPKAFDNPLNWKTRLNIALNAAQGLEYLHTGCKYPIIHRDVKSSNILLTSKMIAKVADFGLSKMNMNEGTSHISTAIKGTIGYVDPEYYKNEQLTTKSDVFSFGIVLLELICGRNPINNELPPSQQQLGDWVRLNLQAGIIHPFVDPTLGNQFNVESMWKVAETAIKSIEPSGVHRPTMMQVVCDLREAIEIEENANMPIPNPTHQTINKTMFGRSFVTHDNLESNVLDNSQIPSSSSTFNFESSPHAK